MTEGVQATKANMLIQQKANLTSLLELLTQEKDVLGQYEPTALENVTNEKNALLEQIQAQDEAIAGHPTLISDIKAGKFEDIMSELSNLMAECKRLNEINGAVIQQSQFTVNRMRTSILEGQGKSSLTYNEKAKTSTGVNTLNIKA